MFGRLSSAYCDNSFLSCRRVREADSPRGLVVTPGERIVVGLTWGQWGVELERRDQDVLPSYRCPGTQHSETLL